MNDTDMIALSVTMMVSMVTGFFSRRTFLAKRKPVVKTYSCPHQEEVEFSGGYREAARQTKKCGYKLRCSIKTSGKAKVDLYCPTHDVKLKS
jgi:hypothetical protein